MQFLWKIINFGGANIKAIMAEENYKNIPNQDWDIFISWHDDKGKVRRCGEELKSFLNHIFDHKKNIFFSRDIPSGQWREHIKDVFGQSKYLFILLTDAALDSGWVNAEYGAFYMKDVLGQISHEDIFALKLPGANTSSTKSPIKDNEIKSTDEESALSSFLMRIDKECKRLFDLNYPIFKDNIAQIQSYNAPTIKEYVHDTPQLVAPVSTHTAPTSIDDISFDSIDFNYNKPKNKNFFGRDAFIKKLRDCFLKGENSLNVVATGGMGKTSVAHRYIEVYGDTYKEIQFVTSNDDICQDFNRELRRCIKRHVPDNDIIFQKNENDAPFITSQIDLILGKAPNDCLLIIDVNIDKEGLAALKLSNAETKWHILYLSRQKIAKTKFIQLSNFEDDLDGAKGLFNSIYPNDWEDYKLKRLFKLVYFHPLLIEHLAAYGIRGQNKKTYQQLCDVVSENRIKNATINKSYSEFSTCFIDKEKTKDVCIYLSQLFDISDYDKDEQYILQHFILWPYAYRSIDTVNQLLKTDEIKDWEDTLIGLSDKVVFTQSSEGYRMHGLLGDTLKSEKHNFDYSNYIANVKTLLSSGEEIDRDTDKCICNTPLEIFGIGTTSDISVYEDWKFLRGLAKLKVADTPLSELSYKAYLLKKLYNNSGEEIYHKVYGEYKNVSSHLIYNEWLSIKSKYNNDLPKEESDVYGKFIVIPINGVAFKMRKVKHGSFWMASKDGFPQERVTLTNDFYIGEMQVTQQLWKAVMGENNNPSEFNEGEKTNNYPVERVSWYDCMDFIIKLNELTQYKKYQFRLPTDMEWKYVARSGGKNHTYSWTDAAEALLREDCKNGKYILEKFAYYGQWCGPQKVGTKRPNELGIYDMNGNVYELCQDCSGDYIPECSMRHAFWSRVGLGGSWREDADGCGLSSCCYTAPDFRLNTIGFRLALSSKHPS